MLKQFLLMVLSKVAQAFLLKYSQTTVHGLQNDKYTPLLFFLLPDKESKSYE